jgi:cobalt-zinc-cadmium efflux system outer membrane protein
MVAERGAQVLALAGLCVALAACASVPRDAGFEDVANLAQERAGLTLAWRRGGPEDAALDEHVRALAGQELTLESAVEIALLENRRLQALYAELGFAQAEVLAAARLPNPIAHAELRFPDGGGLTALDLGIEQNFLALLSMPLRKRLAAEAFEAAKLRLAEEALRLATAVRGAFARLQGAQQMLELRRTSFEAADAAYEFAQRLEAAGNVRALDVAWQRVPREEARLAVADAELGVSETREALVRLLGLHGSAAELRITTRLPELPESEKNPLELEARAVGNSLELAALRHEIERAGARLDLAGREGLVPGLELGAVGEREGDGHWAMGPTLAIPLPIFTRGEPAQRRAMAELERLRATYLAEALELRSSVRHAAARVLALHARVEFLRDVVLPLRQSVIDGVQLEYNAMQEGAFRLLLAKRDQLAAGADYLATLTDYWVAAGELDGWLAGARPRSAAMPAGASAPSSTTSASMDAH